MNLGLLEVEVDKDCSGFHRGLLEVADFFGLLRLRAFRASGLSCFRGFRV